MVILFLLFLLIDAFLLVICLMRINKIEETRVMVAIMSRRMAMETETHKSHEEKGRRYDTVCQLTQFLGSEGGMFGIVIQTKFHKTNPTPEPVLQVYLLIEFVEQ
jgi:hypothetical protein